MSYKSFFLMPLHEICSVKLPQSRKACTKSGCWNNSPITRTRSRPGCQKRGSGWPVKNSISTPCSLRTGCTSSCRRQNRLIQGDDSTCLWRNVWSVPTFIGLPDPGQNCCSSGSCQVLWQLSRTMESTREIPEGDFLSSKNHQTRTSLKESDVRL